MKCDTAARGVHVALLAAAPACRPALHSRPMSRGAGVALVLVSAVCFGFIALFNHWARTPPGGPVGTEMLLFLRFAAAALILGAAAIARRTRMPRGRLLAAAVALGAIGYVGESICYFKALDYIPAGLNAALL